MNLQLLISTMHQNDYILLDRMKINTNVVVINQCDRNKQEGFNYKKHDVLWIDTTQRGLSKSRNMALKNAQAEICLLADDDEIFDLSLENSIVHIFELYPDADIIVFDLQDHDKGLGKTGRKLKLLELLKVSSCQIAFRRKSILKSEVCFDIKMGAGTENGAGEENKFLWDAYHKGLKIYYYPLCIGRMVPSSSTWFKGYNSDYFYKRGKATSHFMGKHWAFLYIIYFVLSKRSLYKTDCRMWKAFKSAAMGIKEGIK